ncbi:hypothetical protein FRX31_033759 [Thalictrum thalictroides]|uniref:Uncharacterized protein n=1 Tax=Thalictrum thalictroides TaxID=46969 RepID=A0A7J6UVM2_THATH|nr:hypothetical protein FRX31_033759 [Thalictrum thalictroides]
MSFPSIPPNFISLQKLQQLRLQEKEDANKKKEDEERETSLKGEEENQNKVTDKAIASDKFSNHKKWYKGGREEVGTSKTVEPVDFEKSKKGKEKEEEITKPTIFNGLYNKKKWHNEGWIRKEEVGFLKTHEPVDFEESEMIKEKEKEENQEKLREESFNGKGETVLGLKSYYQQRHELSN